VPAYTTASSNDPGNLLVVPVGAEVLAGAATASASSLLRVVQLAIKLELGVTGLKVIRAYGCGHRDSERGRIHIRVRPVGLSHGGISRHTRSPSLAAIRKTQSRIIKPTGSNLKAASASAIPSQIPGTGICQLESSDSDSDTSGTDH
jgi:hypothetical protein